MNCRFNQIIHVTYLRTKYNKRDKGLELDRQYIPKDQKDLQKGLLDPSRGLSAL